MTLAFAIMHLYRDFFKSLFLSIPFLYFSLVGTGKLDEIINDTSMS